MPDEAPPLIICLAHRYKDILVSMTESILRKIQLHFNMDELREIDDDTIDDDVSFFQYT